MANVKNILIVGTGGQGVILASDVLSDVLSQSSELEVKKSETHGMSQRGGSVHSQVRFGPNVHAPFISPREADVILAFEEAEGLRWLHYLADDGVMILNTEQIVPPLAHAGLANYPYKEIELIKKDQRVKSINALQIAMEAGSSKVTSAVLLGALASLLDFNSGDWIAVLTKKVPPKSIQANLEAFENGRKAMLETLA